MHKKGSHEIKLHFRDFSNPMNPMKGPVSAPSVEAQFAQKLAANDKKDRCAII